jgi:hypothetical protein
MFEMKKQNNNSEKIKKEKRLNIISKLIEYIQTLYIERIDLKYSKECIVVLNKLNKLYYIANKNYSKIVPDEIEKLRKNILKKSMGKNDAVILDTLEILLSVCLSYLAEVDGKTITLKKKDIENLLKKANRIWLK